MPTAEGPRHRELHFCNVVTMEAAQCLNPSIIAVLAAAQMFTTRLSARFGARIERWTDQCRFHLLKPEYVHHRIKQLQRGYRLRVVLVHVDIVDTIDALSQVPQCNTHPGPPSLTSFAHSGPIFDHCTQPPAAAPRLRSRSVVLIRLRSAVI